MNIYHQSAQFSTDAIQLHSPHPVTSHSQSLHSHWNLDLDETPLLAMAWLRTAVPEATSVIHSSRALSQPLEPVTEPSRSTRSLQSKESLDKLTGLPQAKTLVAIDPVNPLHSPHPQSRAAGLAYPGHVLRYVAGKVPSYDSAAKQWQTRMRERGWSIQVDGFYGAKSAQICRQFQQEKGLQMDGVVGAATWTAAFRADNLTPTTSTSQSISQINARGLDLVKRSEGLVLTAYRDAVGVWTIGYGHTGADVKPGLKITQAQAEALLRRDLSRFETAVRGLVKVPVNTNQFSALVSFTYNVGTGALAQSTLLALLNQRNYQGAADQFSIWIYGGGQALPGLVKRRSEERALFLTPA